MLNTKIGLNRIDGEVNRGSGYGDGGISVYEASSLSPSNPLFIKTRSNSVQHQTIPETTTSNHSSTPFYQYYPQPSSSSFYFPPQSYSDQKQLNHNNNDLDSERKKDERKLSFSKESYADKHGIDGDNNGDNQHNGDDKHNSSPSTANDSKNERTAISRCLALEQAYVHDVYSSIARECGACSPVRSHIKEFLYDEFELGSLLMDVGCGDGKYLNLKSDIFTLGLEKCPDWFNKSNQNTNTIPTNALNMSDLMVADVIYLPVRDEFFDGVLCCGVLHHISTTDRRVSAIKEMCRVIKIGGKLLITVWAFEGRELESQDVLIKWNSSKRNRSRYGNTGDQSSDESTSSCSTSSTTTTNYVNRKAAYESCNSPTSQFGTCYSFVRKALQRFSLSSNTFYHSPRRTSKSSTNRDTTSTSGFATLEDMPIELRNIERNHDPFSSDSPELNHDSSINKNLNGLSKGVPFLGQRAASLFHLSFSQNNHNQTHSTHGPLSASASVSTSVPGMKMEPTQSTYPHAIDNFGPSTAPVSRQNSITSLIGNNRGVRRDSLFNLIRNSITKPIRKTVEPKNESDDSSPINSASQSPYHKLKNKPSKEKSSTGLRLNGFLSQHRFSLPVNLRRSSNRRPVQSEVNNKSSNNDINEDDNLQENELRDHLLSSQESTEVSSELLDNLKDSVDQSVNDEILDKSKVLTGCSLDESIVAGVEDNDEDRDGDDEGEDVAEVDDKRSTVEGEGEKEDMLLMIRSSVAASIAGGPSKRKRELWGKIMQKSLSSDSLESKYSKQSRQQSTGTETGTITTTTTNTTTTTTTNTTSGTSNSASTSESSSKLVAYYSMPELRLLSWSSCDEEDGLDETGLLRNRINRNKPRLSEIHPITFLNSLGINRRESKGSVIRNDSQDTQNALEDTFDHSILEMATISCTSSGSGGGSGGGCGNESHPNASLIPPVYPPPMIPVTLVNKSSFEEASSNSRPPSSSSARSTPLKERLQLNLPSSSARSPSECSSIEGYYYDKSEKDGKTVRSLSVEYKPAICSSYRQGLRRFSASPSLLVSKPFFQLAPHTSGHETHPSVDSEESFVTIIPAGRSCRTGSGTIEASLGDEVDSFMDDVILDIDATSLGSTEDDEALCEQLTRPLGTVDAVGILGRASVQRTSSLGPRSPGIINSSGTNSLANISGASPCPAVLPRVDVSGLGGGVGVVESDDATSASTATTKSLTSLGSSPKALDDDIDEIVDPADEIRSSDSASTPSPPANLHRYFHLFKCGELEEVIEQNVENLHVVKSYYSEHATSWCVVAEKVRVWTI